MPRIAPLDPADANDRQRQSLDAVRALLGATPNMTTTMARSAVLDGWLQLSGALRGGAIGGADAERIALGVAEANGCAYCRSAHGYLAANVAKLDDDEVQRARRFDSAEPGSAAILAFARAVLATRGHVSDADVAAARAAGMSDAQLAEVVGHVAVNVLTNYFNSALGVEVDFPVVEPLASPAVAA
jgi:uncharacterized peroxidase-related enzyme